MPAKRKRSNWKPADGPLMTHWAKDVDPACPLPEYPRPQMTRPRWVNLNGLWEFAVTPKSERENGGHPSQKPLALVERLVLVASKPDDLLLDPFGGTGTLAVAAQKRRRRWLLIESEPQYVEVARRRLEPAENP